MIWAIVKRFFRRMFSTFHCSDTRRLLCDFVEGLLAPELQQKLEAHLSDCPECLAFVASYRRTVAVTHQHGAPVLAMPAELEAKLRQFIQQNVT